ncbi:MAG TPA: SDR family oxidoreductase [Pseudonocardiaceae bacterium]|jgi:3-oxoacyl-[acyl-carrier protein] reductase|nr:SDR family oxidoreductase [Pseudonocardiaceae bacterium]
MTESGPLPFADRTALVTGAGRGIGQQIAVRLAQAGATRLALLARSGDELATTERLVAAAGGKPLVVPTDLGDRQQRARAIATVLAEYGTVDVLVNNAGTADPMGPTVTVDSAEWAHAVELNILAPVDLTLALLPAMLDQRWGRIVNVSSAAAAGIRVLANTNAYVATKAGLEAHTLNLAFELADSGVTVNVYRPGQVDTVMNLHAVNRAQAIDPAMFEFMNKARKEGTLLTPAESAEALLTHLREGSSGQIWHVDRTL